MKNKEIKILLSAPRGFCAGVERAIEIVEKALSKYGAPVYVRHEIVHNKFVVDDLRKKGAIFVEELEEIKDKSRPVIFSAHGVPKKIPQDAENYKMTYVDATCPLVSKVHREAENLHKAGYHLVLIGHQNHPEVIGTMGQLPKGSIDLIQNEEEARNYKFEQKKQLAFVTQTTLSVDDTKDIIQILKKRFPKIREPHKEDICYATTNRQMAVKNIAKNCDMFFVIGSRNSSNSVRLVEVAKKSGCMNSQLIHSQSEIPYDLIENSNTIGISSGASAPEILVENFISNLKKKFKLKPLDPPEPVFKRGNITRTDDPFGPNKLTAAEDRYLANLQDRIDDLEGEIIDQMGNDGREIIDNVNTIGKNLPPEQKINYYREILRQEAGDLPDINNPLDDLP